MKPITDNNTCRDGSRPYRIFVINPGATSTKLALYENDRAVWMSGAHHSAADLVRFHRSTEQYEYRMDFIRRRMQADGIAVGFDAVIGRGGLLSPLPGGCLLYTSDAADEY